MNGDIRGNERNATSRGTTTQLATNASRARAQTVPNSRNVGRPPRQITGRQTAITPQPRSAAFNLTIYPSLDRERDNSNNRKPLPVVSIPSPTGPPPEVRPRPLIQPPEIRLDTSHVETDGPPRYPLPRIPMLGETPRPHSLDVPGKKTKVQRTTSAPELHRQYYEELLHPNGTHNIPEDSQSNSVIQCDGEHSHLNGSLQGSRSRSLPSVALPRQSKRNYNNDANPLRYFAYLGKRFQNRDKLLSARNILSTGPVILTSTSVIAPEVSNNFRNQYGDNETDELPRYQSACQEMIDCCTCMCCVKALFYHCTKDDDNEGELSEHPCSCAKPGTNCLFRWSIMGMMSLCLPCVLCYLPIQGCKRAVDYSRRTNIENTESHI